MTPNEPRFNSQSEHKPNAWKTFDLKKHYSFNPRPIPQGQPKTCGGMYLLENATILETKCHHL